jgi:hypothetical protein
MENRKSKMENEKAPPAEALPRSYGIAKLKNEPPANSHQPSARSQAYS